MQSVGQQLIIAAIPILPALVFFVLVLTGRLFEENAQYVAILGVTVSLVFSVFALLFVAGAIPGGGQPIEFSVNWIDLGEGGSFPMGVYIDGLAAVMLVVVCFVSLMIQLYSGGFMEGDPRFAWYYAVLNLFTASMLGLVLAPNFIELYVCWELVGLCSYLLIGHWYEKPSARDASLKAFIVTRIGDAALFVAIIIFWRASGTTSFDGISEAARAGFIGSSLFTAAVVLVFVGAVGKSAQFPLHVWLPDAMEGPTPVSALIHAATMVAAGVYMLVRVAFIIQASQTALLVVAWIGTITAVMAALIATQQDDIKRILAYSTLSQLGYMVMAVGLASNEAAMFHLFTHAFFKALLFLAAGSVIVMLHHEQDIWKMGGLRRSLPITFATFGAGALALIGCPPFSGFFSKDAILAIAYEQNLPIFAVALFTAFLTAFYVIRMLVIVFFGNPRSDSAREGRESPPVMTMPLIVHAILATLGGFAFFARNFLKLPTDKEAVVLVPVLAIIALILGVGLALALYLGRATEPVKLELLRRKFYFDEFYGWLIYWTQELLARVAAFIDRWFIDAGMVGGSSRGTWGIGALLRLIQVGNLQAYAFLFGLGIVILIYFAVFRF